MGDSQRLSPLFPLHCPGCGAANTFVKVKGSSHECQRCGNILSVEEGFADLLGPGRDATSEHYTLQWGPEKNFLNFLRNNPSARKVMPGAQMGWNDLFAEIRAHARAARQAPVHVYDAACGFGGIAEELIDESTAAGLAYLGADIHLALRDVLRQHPLISTCGTLLRWDISRPLPGGPRFDYVICRAALHHTPEPRTTFAALCTHVKPGGRLAISVYRKKGPAREALDDHFRAMIGALSPHEAYELCRQFTALGKALQQVQGFVTIEQDLPLFGIRQGSYPVQKLFYDHFLKCFFNSEFGDEYSTLVNYDWYHPAYAFRYEAAEIESWFAQQGLRIMRRESIEAQHYFLGERPR